MNYYIVFIDKDDFEWAIISGIDEEYMFDLFEQMSPPPGYNMELRSTDEDLDTHLNYKVIRYDRSDHQKRGVGEYVGKIYNETKNRPVYVVESLNDKPLSLNK